MRWLWGPWSGPLSPSPVGRDGWDGQGAQHPGPWEAGRGPRGRRTHQASGPGPSGTVGSSWMGRPPDPRPLNQPEPWGSPSVLSGWGLGGDEEAMPREVPVLHSGGALGGGHAQVLLQREEPCLLPRFPHLSRGLSACCCASRWHVAARRAVPCPPGGASSCGDPARGGCCGRQGGEPSVRGIPVPSLGVTAPQCYTLGGTCPWCDRHPQ